MRKIVESGPFTGFEVVYSYTRQQAIEDGVLVDLAASFPNETRIFKWPVACTSAVWEMIENAAEEVSVDPAICVWDVCYMAFMAIKAVGYDSDTLFFKVLLPLRDNETPKNLKLVCGPVGPEDPSPALTIMLPEED